MHCICICPFVIYLTSRHLSFFAADNDKVWMNRKSFLMFLSSYQFLYATALPPEDPTADNSIHTCFYSKDLCWSISQFL